LSVSRQVSETSVIFPAPAAAATFVVGQNTLRAEDERREQHGLDYS